MLGRGNQPCTRLPLSHTTRATKGKHGASEPHLSRLGPLPSPTPVAQVGCRPGGPRCREGCVAGPGWLCRAWGAVLGLAKVDVAAQPRPTFLLFQRSWGTAF